MSISGPPSRSDRPPAALSREAQAKLEIGHTEIGPVAQWALVLCFLATIVAIPAIQTARDWLTTRGEQRLGSWLQAAKIVRAIPAASTAWRQRDGGLAQRVLRANAALLRSINDYEDELEQSSFLRDKVLPPAQLVLARAGAGNEKGYIGRDGWLFYRPAMDLVTGPGFLDESVLTRRADGGTEWQAAPAPDPRPAILDFQEQLAARGIRLVLMPTPVKPMIHPEKFSRQPGLDEILVLNPSHKDFLREMEQAGVLVFDPAEAMIAAKLANSGNGSAPAPQFLASDTHWRPGAMDRVAADLAHFLRAHFDLAPGSNRYVRSPVEIASIGDIAGMLQLPKDQRLFPPEAVTIQQVRCANGELWSPDPKAEVLLLGDSFANIYSLAGMNWGENAGLAEQLSFHLDRPLDAILRNDSGAFATRQILATELARGRNRLAGKRVVIWQFAARELAVGDWKRIQLPAPPASPVEHVPIEPTKPEQGDWIATVSGKVAQASDVPGTGVPYKDHIRALYLTGLEAHAGTTVEQEAVVYVWDMRDRVLTPDARLVAGDRVTLRLQPWEKVSDTLGRINRSELDDPELMLLLPWWGERVEE